MTYTFYLDDISHEIPADLPYEELVKLFPHPELKLINPIVPNMYQVINKRTWNTPEVINQLDYFTKKGYKLNLTYKRTMTEEKVLSTFKLTATFHGETKMVEIPGNIEYKPLIEQVRQLFPELIEVNRKWVYWHYHESKPITRILGTKSLDIAKYVNRFTNEFVINIYEPELDPFIGRK